MWYFRATLLVHSGNKCNESLMDIEINIEILLRGEESRSPVRFHKMIINTTFLNIDT